MPNNKNGLYIHIPFCNYICSYCDFAKMYKSTFNIDNYIKALKLELKLHKLEKVDTIYFGGGTPSVLTTEQFQNIFTTIHELFGHNFAEVCVEMNPDDVTITKVKALKKLGVNRISLGVQDLDDQVLKNNNRKHTEADVINALQIIKKSGIDNYSVDFILGLPGQTKNHYANIKKFILKNDLPHFSIYTLILEEHTMLWNQKYFYDEEQIETVYYEMIQDLTAAGYEQYEFSNFTKSQKSLHNLKYWQDQNYIGIGLSSTGKKQNQLYRNTRDIKKYVNNLLNDSHQYAEITYLNNYEMMQNALMMGLRLNEGINLKSLNEKYDLNFKTDFADFYKKHKSSLIIDQNIKIKQEYRHIMNEILQDLF